MSTHELVLRRYSLVAVDGETGREIARVPLLPRFPPHGFRPHELRTGMEVTIPAGSLLQLHADDDDRG